MGCDTRFSGHLTLSRKLTVSEAEEWLSWTTFRAQGPRDGRLPFGNPAGYLQWVPTEDLEGIVHDGAEKFYYYKEWLKWLCAQVLEPWDIVANGTIFWHGEEVGDSGQLKVRDNCVEVICFDMPETYYKEPLTMERLDELKEEREKSYGS